MYNMTIENTDVYLSVGQKTFKGIVGTYNKTNEIEYFFTNTDIIDYYTDFDDIKDLRINDIPSNVTFCILIYKQDESGKENIIKDLEITPFPFEWIDFRKRDNCFSVSFTSVSDTYTWSIKWSRQAFFEELFRIALRNGIETSIDYETAFEGPGGSINFYIQSDLSILDSYKYAIHKLENLIFETKSSLEGLSRFQEVLKNWELQKDNNNEEYWQDFLKNNSWVLSQSLSLPLILFQEKAYMGGKGINNSNGNIVDFVYKNCLTHNLTLVEIKTPKTRLIGKKYRQQVYSLSSELSGAINQILLYKDTCLKDFYHLSNRAKEHFTLFSPLCLLIIGSLDTLSDDERICFELFRNELKSVEVITFDELFNKIKLLLDSSKLK